MTTPNRVLVTRRIPEPGLLRLRAAGLAIDYVDRDDPPPRAELLARAAGAAGVLAMMSERIDAEFLDAAGPSLRVVANFAVGYDNIDVPACTARGVRATNTPGVLTDATADIAWTLILAAARHAIVGDRMVRSGQWRGWAPTQLLGLNSPGRRWGSSAPAGSARRSPGAASVSGCACCTTPGATCPRSSKPPGRGARTSTRSCPRAT